MTPGPVAAAMYAGAQSPAISRTASPVIETAQTAQTDRAISSLDSRYLTKLGPGRSR